MSAPGGWRRPGACARKPERRYPEYDLIVTDAQDATAKQIGDVEDLVARRVDALLVAPRDYDGLEPGLEAAARAHIPVVLIDREAAGVPGHDYVTFLGSDFVAQGRRAAVWLTEKVGGTASIIEISGTPGSSVARDRARGFRLGLSGHPGMNILGTQTAEFTRATALRVMENVLQGRGRNLTAVYAHNDEMALGAIQALRSAGRHPGAGVTVVSIDGERLALEAILRGELGASIESNPRFGPSPLPPSTRSAPVSRCRRRSSSRIGCSTPATPRNLWQRRTDDRASAPARAASNHEGVRGGPRARRCRSHAGGGQRACAGRRERRGEIDPHQNHDRRLPPRRRHHVAGGQPVSFRSPHEAQAHGVVAVYQEVHVLSFSTVAETLFSGASPRASGSSTIGGWWGKRPR